MLKHYTVTKFPSLFGTPKHFNFRVIATLYAIIVNLSLNYGEVNLYDNKKLEFIFRW